MGLDKVNHLQRKRAVVFLLSDFMDHGYERPLRMTARRHDLIAVTLGDPREEKLPRMGLLRLLDAEHGHEKVVDTSRRAVREAFTRTARERFVEREALLRRAGVDIVDVRTDRPYEQAMLQFFRRREMRFR